MPKRLRKHCIITLLIITEKNCKFKRAICITISVAQWQAFVQLFMEINKLISKVDALFRPQVNRRIIVTSGDLYWKLYHVVCRHTIEKVVRLFTTNFSSVLHKHVV